MRMSTKAPVGAPRELTLRAESQEDKELLAVLLRMFFNHGFAGIAKALEPELPRDFRLPRDGEELHP